LGLSDWTLIVDLILMLIWELLERLDARWGQLNGHWAWGLWGFPVPSFYLGDPEAYRPCFAGWVRH
jgi:hypothetical protein